MPQYHQFIDLSRRRPYLCAVCRLDIKHPIHQPTIAGMTFSAPDRRDDPGADEPETEMQHTEQLSLF